MQVLMYMAALLVLVLGVGHALVVKYGVELLPADQMTSAKEITQWVLWAIAFAALGRIYGLLKRVRSGEQPDGQQSGQGQELPTTVRMEAAQPSEPADDDLFLIVPEEKK